MAAFSDRVRSFIAAHNPPDETLAIEGLRRHTGIRPEVVRRWLDPTWAVTTAPTTLRELADYLDLSHEELWRLADFLRTTREELLASFQAPYSA